MDIEMELELATNLLGPLPETVRERVRRFFSEPGEDTWEDIHSIIVASSPMTTVWQSVLHVDPAFSREGPVYKVGVGRVSGWPAVPSPETVRKALVYATH